MSEAAALAALFRAAGVAHHQAFAATDGDDPDWPDWYGRYLSGPLSGVLGRPLDPSAIAADLRAAEAAMRAQAPASEWTSFYADWFLSRRRHHAGG